MREACKKSTGVISLIVLLVLFGLTVLCLTGCSSDEYIEVDGKRLSINACADEIEENFPKAEDDFVGKDVTIVSRVEKVSSGAVSVTTGSNHATQVSCVNGYLVLEGGFEVGIPDQSVDIAKSLSSGDLVKVSGVICGLSDTGKTAALFDSQHVSGRAGLSLPAAPSALTIEKM